MPSGSDYMIALVEYFVLKSIGQLSPAREEQIAKLEPWLNVTFRNTGSWDQSIAKALGFPATIQKSFNDLFRQYLQHCSASGESSSPETFAKQVAENNFAAQIRGMTSTPSAANHPG